MLKEYHVLLYPIDKRNPIVLMQRVDVTNADVRHVDALEEGQKLIGSAVAINHEFEHCIQTLSMVVRYRVAGLVDCKTEHAVAASQRKCQNFHLLLHLNTVAFQPNRGFSVKEVLEK